MPVTGPLVGLVQAVVPAARRGTAVSLLDMAAVAPVVRPLGAEQLVARRSEKWADQPAGVIASTVAEMDFEVARPVLAVLRAALERHDLGYVSARVPALATAFAGFAARRMGWQVDPEQVVPVTDVMAGVASLCRALTLPGDTVALASLNYPPFSPSCPEMVLCCGTLG